MKSRQKNAGAAPQDPLARLTAEDIKQGPKDPDRTGFDDGIPRLLNDDPVHWENVGAAEADAIAAAAIRRAARR